MCFDTTSTCFETPFADEKYQRDTRGEVLPTPTDTDTDTDAGDGGGGVKVKSYRTWGKSKDSRPDLPQIVIGMAVTREGIPVRVWSWPGSTSDSALIRQVHSDMREWTLSRVFHAADRGFTSEANRRDLMKGGDGYILGEKLRSGSAQAKAALSRADTYKKIQDNMWVKEVRIQEASGASDRFIVCLNPDQATRDATMRATMVSTLSELITATDTLPPTRRAEIRGRIHTMPGLNRYLRVTPQGLLRVDKAAITRGENLDGKYLLRTSSPHLSAQDVALGYKQLLQVERGWRDMLSTLDPRPVHHRLEQRIRAHVTLCWIALLLTRIVENTTGQTWTSARTTMNRLHQVTLQDSTGTTITHTRPTSDHKAILTAPGLTPPPLVTDLQPTNKAPTTHAS